tara:strand:- start:1274 stop:1579 length:306 start_codon:yes stop_codon:yes gene_type:complete
MMRYIHINPIPIADEEYKDFRRIGFRAWIFEQAEARNLSFDHVSGSKPITKHTRAKRAGTLLLCPKCKKTFNVYHFSWITLKCLNCRAFVNKYDWRIADEE